MEGREGWLAAWKLVARQLSESMPALRSLPGRKRLSFQEGPVPHGVLRYGAGYPLREELLEAFFPLEGEDWEDWEDW